MGNLISPLGQLYQRLFGKTTFDFISLIQTGKIISANERLKMILKLLNFRT